MRCLTTLLIKPVDSLAQIKILQAVVYFGCGNLMIAREHVI